MFRASRRVKRREIRAVMKREVPLIVGEQYAPTRGRNYTEHYIKVGHDPVPFIFISSCISFLPPISDMGLMEPS